jgi:hypothetical protein
MNKKIERWRGFVPDTDLATYAKGAFGNPIRSTRCAGAKILRSKQRSCA